MRKVGIETLKTEDIVAQKELEIAHLKNKLTQSESQLSQTSNKIKSLTQQVIQLYNNNQFSSSDLSDERSLILIKTVLQSLEKKKNSLFQHINALNSLDEGIAIFDKKGKVTFHNKAFQTIIGSKNELTDLHWSYFFSNEDKFFICKKIVRILRKEELVNQDFSFLNNDLKKTSIVFKLSHVDESHFMCTIKDVTNDKGKNNLIRQQSKLIEASSDFIGITDNNFNFTFLNEAAKKLIGITNTSLSISFTDLILQKNTQFQDIEYQLEVTGQWIGELDLRTNTGKSIPINTQISIGSKTQSSKKCYHIIIQDLSERKKAFNKVLKAKNIAEKNMELRQQFLANMSHEIRTPMNAIIGLSNLLSETKLNSTQKEYVDSVKLSSENLLVILNDILDQSKIESGNLSFESIPFSLEELIDSIEKIFMYKIQEKNLTFSIKKSPLLPKTIIGDPTRLSQVLINLINNAIKFTSKGGIQFSIQNTSSKKDQVELKFSIKDTGIGIAKNKFESIFKPFTQEKQDTTRKFGGTGLGLAIVKQITESQNGKIQVKSTVGEGSEFVVQLPFEIGKEIKQPVICEKNNRKTKLQNAEILMAEDYPMNQLLAKSLFNKWGLNLDIVNNGIEAIEAIHKKRYDIILMDIQMPEMDGIETTLKLREQGVLTPIIAITAHAFKEEREKCLKTGMNDFIAKPFKEDDVFEKLIYFSNLKENDIQEVNNIEINEINSLNGQHSFPDQDDIDQFLLYAPGLIHDFEKAIELEDKFELKKSGILLQTLFRQINKKDFSKQFYSIARGKQLKDAKYQELLMMSKALFIEVKEFISHEPTTDKKPMEEVEMDLAQIKVLAEGNDGFGKEMIDLYINQSKDQLHEIDIKLKENDFLKIGGLIHSMKASFTMLNCKTLSGLAIELEDGCKRNTLTTEEIIHKLKPFKSLTEQSFETIIKLGKKENLI